MDKYFKWKVLLILGVVVFSIWKLWPPQEKINLGLDLQGGMHLLLEVDLTKVPEAAKKDATDRVVEIVRNRIDQLGVREPIISKQGKNQVVVQLPGVTDRERAKEIVGRTAHLEFKLVTENPDLLQKAEAAAAQAEEQPKTQAVPKAEAKAQPEAQAPAKEKTQPQAQAPAQPEKAPEPATMPEGYELKTLSERGREETLLLEKEPVLIGDRLTNASVGFDQYGQPIVQLQLDNEGAKTFDRVTFQNIGRRLAIVLDGRVYSAPVIRDRIPSGQAQISGNFSSRDASDLALVLRAGALPAPVSIVEERTVGPTLGRDSIEKSLRAGALGVLLVFLFMPAYYLLKGFVADIGLVIYSIIVIGLLATLKATLTLPGIAGFILSIGMAVDANVLLNERVREELDAGKTARAAISAGYHKAFSAILDTHATTLVTSVILFIFGTGPVQGFAVTLTIGIIASLFSAVFITRVIMDYLTTRNQNLSLKMHHLFPKTHINFLKGRFFAYGFSALTLIIGITAFVMRGQTNFGVEFTGGTMVRLGFQKPVDIAEVRKMFDKSGIHEAVIQRYGETGQNQFIAKTEKAELKKIEKLVSETPESKILSVDDIGSTVSKDLKKKALWAVFWSSVGILVYLGWRYEFMLSLVAVIALLHDTFFTFGVYALSGREINLPIVAAILTIMGYSVNDTIITFDRVRDNLKIMRKTPFDQIVNMSINQTLSRTILSTFTTLLTTSALFILGGSAINDFAFTLLIGFSVGVYSTVFVASALAVDLKAH